MNGDGYSEAIILAGGLGTRLRPLVADLPKPMAAVGGRPFLEYLMDYLIWRGIKRIIVAAGYKSETIMGHFADGYRTASVRYSMEPSPLGTGGGIRKALEQVTEDSALVVNGDTIFMIDPLKLARLHRASGADITMGLKRMKNSSRYGSVILRGGRVAGFGEKLAAGQGLVNGGIYLVRRDLFRNLALPAAFSFERELLEPRFESINIAGLAGEDYFIDIGVAEDFRRAQTELPLIMKPYTVSGGPGP